MAAGVPAGDRLDDQWVAAWRSRGWGASATGVGTVLALFEVHRLLTNRIDRALRPIGLTLARFEVLTLLLHADGQPLHVSGLASALQVHATSVSSALDRLEVDRLVSREQDRSDHRRTLVRLTARGRERACRASALLRSQVLSDLGLSDEATATLLRVLGSMRANAGDFVPTVSPRARSA
jgi:DNA-binding MarR family transcriptional regulator